VELASRTASATMSDRGALGVAGAGDSARHNIRSASNALQVILASGDARVRRRIDDVTFVLQSRSWTDWSTSRRGAVPAQPQGRCFPSARKATLSRPAALGGGVAQKGSARGLRRMTPDACEWYRSVRRTRPLGKPARGAGVRASHFLLAGGDGVLMQASTDFLPMSPPLAGPGSAPLIILPSLRRLRKGKGGTRG